MVWYLGEDTAEFENGKVATREGSFEAGVDGAQPGVIMPASPEVGMTYRQEYYQGEAEDNGEVLALGEQASVPAGDYDDLVKTADTTPLEPDVLEHKYYADGVGWCSPSTRRAAAARNSYRSPRFLQPTRSAQGAHRSARHTDQVAR